MRVLELFAGTCSFSKVSREKGFETFTSDIEPMEGINYCCNVLDFDYSKVPFVPDVIWASPPCETWSTACPANGGNLFWESIKKGNQIVGIKPRENFTGNCKARIYQNPELVKQKRELHVKILEKTLEIIEYYKPKFYFIENPYDYMRFHLKDRVPYCNLVNYCMYDCPHKKPTTIFSNIELCLLLCDGKHKHDRLTDQIKKYHERSIIPNKLCEAINADVSKRLKKHYK
jgi:hypothetical protein